MDIMIGLPLGSCSHKRPGRQLHPDHSTPTSQLSRQARRERRQRLQWSPDRTSPSTFSPSVASWMLCPRGRLVTGTLMNIGDHATRPVPPCLRVRTTKANSREEWGADHGDAGVRPAVGLMETLVVRRETRAWWLRVARRTLEVMQTLPGVCGKLLAKR